MPSEFDKIKGLDRWRAKLEELLSAARGAAAADDLDARLEIADRLTEFIIRNPPALAQDPASLAYEEMDRIAKEAHDGLLLASIQERVAAIAGRTAELARLTKEVESQVAENEKAAATLRLEKARRMVDATTGAIATMLDLKKELECAAATGASQADWEALATEINTLVARIQKLRNDVETAL